MAHVRLCVSPDIESNYYIQKGRKASFFLITSANLDYNPVSKVQRNYELKKFYLAVILNNNAIF